jgi:hypothetical protein
MRRYQAHGLSVSVTHLPIYFRQHVTLMLAFRNDVRIKSNDIGVIGAIGDEVPTQVVLFISCHYIIRKTCEALSLLSLSPVVFRSYFTNIWTLFDVLQLNRQWWPSYGTTTTPTNTDRVLMHSF